MPFRKFHRPTDPDRPRGAVYRLGLLVAPALLLPLVTGCGDLTLDPAAELVAPETAPSLQFRGGVPALPDIVDQWGRHMALSATVEEWKRSWEESPEDGRRTRDELRQAVSTVLAPSLEPDDLKEAVRALDLALRATNHLLGKRVPSGLVPSLDAARDERDRALASLETGDVEATLLHLLAGCDLLHSLTPSVMARELIADADATLRRNQENDTYSERNRRSERLLVGARTALDDGSPVLALRRAWYAVRLVDGLDPDTGTDR